MDRVDAMSDLETRARKVLPPVLGHYTWLSIERGQGSWLHTTGGRRILDLTCGIAVTVVGHAHPRVVKAVTEQAARLMHISAGVAKYESNVALAEALATITPSGLDTVFFGNSGAEAVEGAIKLSRQTTGREAIIAFRGGFHGRTVGAATLTTSKAQYRRGYGALLPEVYIAPYPYLLACALPDPHTRADGALAHRDAWLDLRRQSGLMRGGPRHTRGHPRRRPRRTRRDARQPHGRGARAAALASSPPRDPSVRRDGRRRVRQQDRRQGRDRGGSRARRPSHHLRVPRPGRAFHSRAEHQRRRPPQRHARVRGIRTVDPGGGAGVAIGATRSGCGASGHASCYQIWGQEE